MIVVRRSLSELGTNALIAQVRLPRSCSSTFKFTDNLCVDFDLCSTCLTTQPENIGSHLRSHSLFAIEEPGGVWVHTVFSSGGGTPDVPELPATNEGPAEPPKPAPEIVPETQEESIATVVDEVPPTVHHAACDLCDSTIRGDRYVSINHTLFEYRTYVPIEVFRLPRFRYVRVMLRDHTHSASSSQLCPPA